MKNKCCEKCKGSEIGHGCVYCGCHAEKNGFLNEWEISTQHLAEYFASLFDEDAYTYWIGGDVGGVFFVNDYFFNFPDIVHFIKYDYPIEKIIEYYNYRLNLLEKEKKEVPINIKNYLKLK